MKHSKKHLKKHFDYSYLVLIIGLILGFFAYLLTQNQPALQVGAVITTGLFYILWGTLHHAKQDEFHFKIILEYTLVATLAVMLLLSLIFRT
jgi:hypothetical protein